MSIHQEPDVKFAGLSNAEIMLIYYRFRAYVTVLEDNLDKRQVRKSVETPMGLATVIENVPQEHVDQFRNTEFYKLTKNVLEKLAPLVELIEECDPKYQALANELR